ncbi:hypothetical protein LC593_35500, partial [Nostoc sp. CHAB 5844]|nr:hypothetical protein [Nostoc sp. CHAB 5844]
RRISLRTRDPARARILGLLLNSNYEKQVELAMFSDEKKKKGISINPLNFVQGPDGSLNVTEINTDEDFAQGCEIIRIEFKTNSEHSKNRQKRSRFA